MIHYRTKVLIVWSTLASTGLHTLQAQTLPSGEINAPPTVIGDLQSIGSNTTLNVLEGGVVGKNFDAGLSDGTSTDVIVNISGGSIGSQFQAFAGSTIAISGGTVGSYFEAESGSTATLSGGSLGSNSVVRAGSSMNITGGTVGTGFSADGGLIEISGGTIGSGFRAWSGSTVNIIGGNGYRSLAAETGSTVNINGGAFDFGFKANLGSSVSISGGSFRSMDANPGSSVEFLGGEFRLNGAPYAGSSITLIGGDVFSGTFADGSPYLFTSGIDTVDDVSLMPTQLPPIDLTPIVIDGSGATAPVGLRSGQTLTLRDGGVLSDSFLATGATLNIEGGVAGLVIQVAESSVNISGGAVGNELRAFSNSTINISGGTVGRELSAFSGSTVNISGGSVGERLRAFSSSTINIEGGIVGNSLMAHSGSTINISGGTLGGGFSMDSGSTVNISGGVLGDSFKASGVVNITGSDFFLGGVPVELDLGVPRLIQDRNTRLSGLLEDGAPFDFDLSTSPQFLGDYFPLSAVLTLTLTSNQLGPPGDYNADGVVDAADYTVWRDNLGAAAGTLPNDVDGGEIGAAQYATWRDNYGAAAPLSEALPAATTPEPGAALLLSLGCMAILSARTAARQAFLAG